MSQLLENELLQKFKRGSMAALFLELARPDKEGFSREVYVEEFEGKYERLYLGNGGSWCRDDGPLGKVFNIQREKDKGRIIFVRLHGFNKTPQVNAIPQAIRSKVTQRKCVVLHTSKPEVDHRDGRKDVPAPISEDDFQPLSKAANNAKRQHCKDCAQTDRRFDATVLGFRKAQIQGDGIYRGSCVGCYWYDPKAFAAFFVEPSSKRDSEK